MLKKIAALSLLFALSALPVHAQLIYQNSTLKDALVEYLYQYGKEVFFRGIDPQEASFVFQRALALDCHHQGSQDFLNKLHAKYPAVSIRIWGCAESQEAVQESEALPADDQDADVQSLAEDYAQADRQLRDLESDLKDKDATISRYQSELKSKMPQAAEDPGYETIAQDQKDLIRIQQNNIDYLKNELAQTKKQLTNSGASSDADYVKAQVDIAASGLDVQEQKMAVEAKDAETKDLRQRLNELQEQLALVQKIVDEKNRTIASLEEQLRSSGAQ